MMWPPIPFLTSDPVPRHEEPTLVSAILSISLPSPPPPPRRAPSPPSGLGSSSLFQTHPTEIC